MPRTQPARTSPRPASEYHLSAVFSTLVAVADDAAAESAIRFTNILAREHGAVPTVLRVLDMSMYAAVDAMPSIIGVEAALLSPEYRDEVVAALEEQIRSVLGTPTRWRIEFETGDTGRCIARHAQQIRAELIVIGLRPHSTLRRAFVRDTVCDVIRGTTIPVLAVRPSLRGLPSRVMVAMDFSMASLRAAHLAREMIGYSGSMELVYVRSPGGQADVNARTWHNADGLEEALDRLIEDLHPTPDVQITSVIREGDAGTQLLTHAEQSQPQLVALGSEHQSIVDRFFNDSVSTTFAHDARWSLLMVPEHGE
ncbi:MAG TPA: universal stress protein [Candidatus Elarobacter sp.]|nr:universal stress protein [Candidatus Elarobacter sp.]